MTRRTTTLTVAALLLVTLVSAAFLLPVPYVTFEPGPAINTLGTVGGKPIIEISGDVKTYPTKGELDLTTVSVTRPGSRVGLGQAFQGWFDSDIAVLPRGIVYPPEQTEEQAQQETVAQMTSSQQTSEVSGLTEAGYDVSTYVQITSVTPGGPSDGSLQPGDRIVSVNGQQISGAQQMVDQVTKGDPGQDVTLVVRRDGERSSVTVTSVPDETDASVPRIGVALGLGYDLPFTVTNNVSDTIGGPSAGTMFALAIYDKLTPGDIAGDQIVAGTGEITAQGQVGSIGGIQQKLVGAFDVGATVFLAPADNCAEALGAPVAFDQMRLVKITTLHDAVTSLEALADDPRADVPSCG